jgi:hypothetical protein
MTMDFPAMSAKGFPGNLLDSALAGMNPTIFSVAILALNKNSPNIKPQKVNITK